MQLDLDSLARDITIDYLVIMRNEAREHLRSLAEHKDTTWGKEQLAQYGRILRSLDAVLYYMTVDPDEAEMIYSEHRSNKGEQ